MSEAAATFGTNRSASGQVWAMRALDDRHVLAMTQQGLPETLARLLVARDVAPQDVSAYLDPKLRDLLPDPSILKDADKAAERLADAVEKREPIAIFGDYDVDGATSSAVLARYLAGVDVPPRLYIPDRQKEGYGPNQAAFDLLYEEGFRLVVTVDCGTMAHEVLRHAKSRGMDVIVADHHQTGGGLPECFALVNPRRADCASGLGYLAAVGVSFLLVVALNRCLRQRGFFASDEFPEPNLMSLLDMVALGTVCDVVPLQGLNRAFVRQGLRVAEKGHNIGMAALAKVSGKGAWEAYRLGFQLGPRVTAGGRVGQSELGARLLTTDDPQEASALALRLHEYNIERGEIEKKVLHEAMAEIDDTLAAKNELPPFLLQARRGWHAGVIGIVAGRLKDRFSRPSFVIAIDENGVGKGSARSVAAVDIGRVVAGAVDAGVIEAGGGHAMAAGVTLHESQLSDFRSYLAEQLGDKASDMDAPRKLFLDASLTPSAATRELYELMQRAGPFGAGSPEPRVVLPSVRAVYVREVGEGHVSCTFTDMNGGRLKAIAFATIAEEVRQVLKTASAPLHVAGYLRADDWNGRRDVQLVVHDVAESKGA